LFLQEVISLLVFTPIQVINPKILKTIVLWTFHLRPYEKQDFSLRGFHLNVYISSLSVPCVVQAPGPIWALCRREYVLLFRELNHDILGFKAVA